MDNLTLETVGVFESKLQSPNSAKESFDLSYTGISYADCKTIEDSFKASKGIERFLWEGNRYILSDGYTVSYNNSTASIMFSLQRVGV
jgi:hypothetical protein